MLANPCLQPLCRLPHIPVSAPALKKVYHIRFAVGGDDVLDTRGKHWLRRKAHADVTSTEHWLHRSLDLFLEVSGGRVANPRKS